MKPVLLLRAKRRGKTYEDVFGPRGRLMAKLVILPPAARYLQKAQGETAKRRHKGTFLLCHEALLTILKL
jgi:hypothetical protein